MVITRTQLFIVIIVESTAVNASEWSEDHWYKEQVLIPFKLK